MKKFTPIIILLLAAISLPVSAEVIKCKLASGKIVYQMSPCPSETVGQAIVEIKKEDPRRLEEAQIKLKAWQAEQEANEASKITAAKILQEESDRRETINALNRNAIAQEEQVRAAKMQAEALERYNQSNNYNRPYWPYYPYLYHDPYERNPNNVRFQSPGDQAKKNTDKSKHRETYGWRPSK